MKIAIGADHAGYQLKDAIRRQLEDLGIAYEDFGTSSAQSVDYPDFASKVCDQIKSGAAPLGVLICGTGIGMSIAANKFPGVRAAPCHDDLTAEMSRRHNDLNVLCLSADMLGEKLIDRMVEIWLSTPFEGGRHARRVERQGACGGDGLADFAIRILVEDHVDGTASEAGPCGRRQFVGYDPQRAAAAGSLDRRDQARIAGAQIVEAGEIGMIGQEPRNDFGGFGALVMALYRADNGNAGEFRRQGRPEALEPLGVVAQVQRTGHDRNLAALGQETAHERSRGASGGDIVDTDEVAPRRLRQVGHQRHDGNAAAMGRLDGRVHLRLVPGDHNGTVALARIEGVQPGGQRIGIERADPAHIQMHAIGQRQR